MRKLLPSLFSAGLGVALLLPVGRAALAQSALSRDQEADSLIERIRSARARQQEPASGTSRDGKVELSEPGEGKTGKSATQGGAAVAPKRREPVTVTPDPYEYLRQMGTVPPVGRTEVLKPYDIERTPAELLERIRESRTITEKEKQGQTEPKETTARPTTPEPSPLDYRQPVPNYSLDDKYLSPLRELSDVIGADALRRGTSPAGAATDVRRSTSPTDLPDPNKDLNRYETTLREQYGVRGTLPQYVDENLRGTYEAGRFKNWLQNEYETRIETGQLTVPQLSNVYREFGNLPPVSESLGRRDVYIPYSQNFLNNTYRGTIYSGSSTSDPQRMTWSPVLSQSKYSSLDYYNLNTFDSFSDYYQREYGVSHAFVPGSTARQYDVNTMKQWSESLRRDYGIDVGAGHQTYADLYRVYTSKPGY